MADLVRFSNGQYFIGENHDVSTTGVLQLNHQSGNGSSVSTTMGALDADGFDRYLSSICVAMVTIFTIMGNIVIIICVFKSRTLNSTNYSVYVLSMASADLAVGLIPLPRQLMLEILGMWPLGKMACAIFNIIDYCFYSVSMLHLCAMSFDRLQAVAHPLKYRSEFTRGRSRKISAVIWALSIIAWTPPILVTMLPDVLDDSIIVDQCLFLPHRILLLILVILGYYPFIIAMVVMYILLLVVLKMRNVHQATSNEVEVVENQSNSTNTKYEGMGRNVAAQESSKMSGQNKRVIKILGVLIFVMFICWTPWAVFWPIKRGYCDECISDDVYFVTLWMLYANSCINPYLYFMFNLDFRKAFVQIFCQPK